MEQTLHNAFKRFSLGDELRAYTFLGCHAAERDGVHGYVFRVWAPRAQGVSVTGDWNFWNTEDLPMTLVEYGIWEAFSAYAREGDAYKFYIRRRGGDPPPDPIKRRRPPAPYRPTAPAPPSIYPIPMPSATVRCPTRRAVSVRWSAIPGAMPTTAASRASVSCSTAR